MAELWCHIMASELSVQLTKPPIHQAAFDSPSVGAKYPVPFLTFFSPQKNLAPNQLRCRLFIYFYHRLRHIFG